MPIGRAQVDEAVQHVIEVAATESDATLFCMTLPCGLNNNTGKNFPEVAQGRDHRLISSSDCQSVRLTWRFNTNAARAPPKGGAPCDVDN